LYSSHLSCPVASDVTVKLNRVERDEDHDELYKSGIQLLIEDNGTGFDVSTPWGLGLLGMRERIEALNGTFVMKSGINEGVEIVVTL